MLGLSKAWSELIGSYAMSSNALKAIPRHGKTIYQVVGLPRSGTTVLAASLENRRDTICLIEPYLSWLTRGYFEFTGRKNPAERMRMVYNKPPHQFIKAICEQNELSFAGFKETFRDRSHPTFPTESFIMRNVQEKCVDATIAIVRDPRDVWVSVITRFEETRDTPLTDEFTDCWNKFCQWALDEPVLLVRYEDLVTEPELTFQSICCYLGTTFSPSMLEWSEKKGFGDRRAQSGGRIFISSVGRYKEGLNLQAQRFIEVRCETLMARLGYEVPLPIQPS